MHQPDAICCRSYTAAAARPAISSSLERQLLPIRMLASLAGALPNAVGQAFHELLQACLAADAAPHRELVDGIIAGLCTAASSGAVSAWPPACAALGRQTGVLAGRRYQPDRLHFAATQLARLATALSNVRRDAHQGYPEVESAASAWLDILSVCIEAMQRSSWNACTTRQLRR